MKKNVGTIDKVVRIIIGLAVAYYGYTYESLWGLLALVPFGTAFMGSCPIYSIVGIKTCKVSD